MVSEGEFFEDDPTFFRFKYFHLIEVVDISLMLRSSAGIYPTRTEIVIG